MASIVTSFLFPTKISGTMSTFSDLNLSLPKTLIFKFSVRIAGNLKSDSHVPENFCQSKIFPSHVRKNIMICLFGA